MCGEKRRGREPHTDTQRTNKDKGHLWPRAETASTKRCRTMGDRAKGRRVEAVE